MGIAVDAAAEVTGRAGGSEDLMAIDTSHWTEDLERQAIEAQEKLEILVPGRLEMYRSFSSEYPDGRRPPVREGLSRQQRRALERAEQKAQKKWL